MHSCLQATGINYGVNDESLKCNCPWIQQRLKNCFLVHTSRLHLRMSIRLNTIFHSTLFFAYHSFSLKKYSEVIMAQYILSISLIALAFGQEQYLSETIADCGPTPTIDVPFNDPNLPDPFNFFNVTLIETENDWTCRREKFVLYSRLRRLDPSLPHPLLPLK